MDRDKAIRAAKLTLGGMLEKKRHGTAVSRADGQIAPSKYLPNVPRQVHADGGRENGADGITAYHASPEDIVGHFRPSTRDVGIHFAANPNLAHNAAVKSLMGRSDMAKKVSPKAFRINASTDQIVDIPAASNRFDFYDLLEHLHAAGKIDSDTFNKTYDGLQDIEDRISHPDETMKAQNVLFSEALSKSNIKALRYMNNFDAGPTWKDMEEGRMTSSVTPDHSYIVTDPSAIQQQTIAKGGGGNVEGKRDFTRDNPGGEWLEGKQARATQYPDRKFVVGAATGVIGGRSNMFLPTHILKGIAGLNDEARTEGDYKYDDLLSDAQKGGFDHDQKGNKVVVAVNHYGQPYLLEGNTRVAVAHSLGIPKVKAEVRYWNGAESVEGPMHPEKVFGMASDNPDITKAAGGAASAPMFQGVHESLQNEGGAPLDLYHGTPQDKEFEAFDDKKLGVRDVGFYGRGHYLAPTRDNAEEYGGDDGTVIGPLHAALKNPYMWDVSDDMKSNSTLRDLQSMGIMRDKKELRSWDNLQQHHVKSFMAEMSKRGHDGVVVKTGHDHLPNGIAEVVAFDPKTIKHTDAEAFDPTDPRIRREDGGEVDKKRDFQNDNPGGEWLEGKQARASQYPDRKFVVGATTGVIGSKSSMFLPTHILKGIAGLNDEVRTAGVYKYDDLLSDARKGGFDHNQKGNKVVVAVNHYGQPYLLEGNTRVAVAHTLGIPKVKAEVRYWNGAENVDGPMHPEKVFGMASANSDITKADGGRVTDTDEFRNWFGSSVTHTNGDPHVFYTGTSKDKDFTSHNVGRHGAWFTRDPEEASQYAEQNDSQGYKIDGHKITSTNTASRVIPAYVKAENPYTGDLPEKYLRNNYKAAHSEWFDSLRAKGHDAWIPASQNGNLVVALNEPQQIKSIFNSGKFDPNQKHMSKAAGGAAMGYVPMATLQTPRLAVARAPVQQQQAPAARFSESLSSLMGTIDDFKKKPEAAPTPSPSAATEGHAPQGVSEAAAAAYGRLTDAYGKPLTINSAYRDPKRNAEVGGADNSQHTQGNAYDVDVTGMPHEDRVALANEAWNAGFRGIGFYDNSMHFDVGSPRGWGPSHSRDSIPEWAQGFTNERYGYAGGGRTLNRMGMYSKALEIAKNMQQTKGTPEQFMAQLKNTAGIKKAEIEAIGMPKGESITRDDFVKHISSRLPFTFTTQYGENPNYLSAEESAFMRNNYMKELSPEDNEKRNALYARQIARPSHEVDEDSDDGEPARTAYKDYTVDGGSNYRERLIRLKGDPAYNSSHWNEPNVVAHVRMQDRMSGGDRDAMRPSMEKLAGHLNVGVRDLGSGSADVGVKNGVISPEEAATISRLMKWRNGYEGKKGVDKKLLHVEEIQSDWAQDGRKDGFHDPQNPFEIFRGETGEVVSRHPDYSSMWDAYRTNPESNQLDYVDARKDKVSSAPYIKNTQHWTDLAMKNIMREAALGDYDGVVFTPGATQVERYDGMENPEGLKGYYDDIVPKSAMSVVQQHDKSIKPQAMKVDGANDYFHVPLTSTAKDSIIKNGFTMFNRGGAVDEQGGNEGHVMEIEHNNSLTTSVSKGYASGGNVGGMMLRMRRAGINSKDDFWSRWRDTMRATAGPDPRLSSFGSHSGQFQRIDDLLNVHRQDAEKSGLSSVLNQYGTMNDQGHMAARIPREIFQKAGIEPTIENAHAAYESLPQDESGRKGFANGGFEDGNAPSNFEARPQAGGLSNAGGVRGGSGLLQAQNEASLEGLPQKVVIPMTGQVIQAGADPRIRQVARDYMDQAGLQYSPPTRYAKVDPKRAARIASDYNAMEDNPDDPLTKASYDAMIKETMGQYESAKKAGLKVEFWNPRKQEDPYKASPRLATEDVRNNHHMWVFPTYSGYGSGEPISEDDAKKNPLLQLTGETWNGIPVTVNDVFRAIHDYYGHAKEGLGFRADGEENAWRAHAAMFSPLARMAMTSETRGQNSWLNYGPHGEHNRKARTEDTIFAPQKIGVLSHISHHDGAEDFIKPEEISLMASIRNRFGKKLGGAVNAALALTRRFTKDGKSAIGSLKPKGK